jgi:hypothetical protein
MLPFCKREIFCGGLKSGVIVVKYLEYLYPGVFFWSVMTPYMTAGGYCWLQPQR